MMVRPAAFVSYVRSDDKYGRISAFRENLSDEVCLHIGEKFPIFQDRTDISWGQNWRRRIEESLNAVTFFIPIITPGFFNSPACRDELELFLDRERELGRDDLILPVYYVDCPLLNDGEKRAGDQLAVAIAERQYADWRELRFEPYTSPQVCKTLERLAVQIRDALEVVKPSGEAAAEPKRGTKQRPRGRAARRTGGAAEPMPSEVAESTGDALGGTRGPYAKTEPPTLVVDAMRRGDHATIGEAIEAASPGDRILVRPGLYEEGLVIDKPLEIIGEGQGNDVVVRATGKDALLFKTSMGRVSNLALRQMGGGKWFGVDIGQGRLELEGCDISSDGLACVAIHGGADPKLRRNRIHDGNGSGVFVYEDAQGTLEDNEIFGNALAGVEIKEAGNPTVRRNRIHDGKQTGVYVHDKGLGTVEDNDIFGNALAGVAIKEAGNPTVRRNRIHDGKQSGVCVYEDGHGTLEDNDIVNNAKAGVLIQEGGSPVLRRNRINRNGYEAVWLRDKGGGTIEDNDLRDNARGPWDVSADSEPNLKRARNLE